MYLSPVFFCIEALCIGVALMLTGDLMKNRRIVDVAFGIVGAAIAAAFICALATREWYTVPVYGFMVISYAITVRSTVWKTVRTMTKRHNLCLPPAGPRSEAQLGKREDAAGQSADRTLQSELQGVTIATRQPPPGLFFDRYGGWHPVQGRTRRGACRGRRPPR